MLKDRIWKWRNPRQVKLFCFVAFRREDRKYLNTYFIWFIHEILLISSVYTPGIIHFTAGGSDLSWNDREIQGQGTLFGFSSSLLSSSLKLGLEWGREVWSRSLKAFAAAVRLSICSFFFFFLFAGSSRSESELFLCRQWRKRSESIAHLSRLAFESTAKASQTAIYRP